MGENPGNMFSRVGISGHLKRKIYQDGLGNIFFMMCCFVPGSLARSGPRPQNSLGENNCKSFHQAKHRTGRNLPIRKRNVTTMAPSKAGTAVAEPTDVHSAAPEAQLAQAISDRAASYTGPIKTPVGKALWAIQAWYAELGDEVHAEALLVASTRKT